MKKVSKNNKFLFYELGALDPPPEARADPNHSWWSEARTAASDSRDLRNAPRPARRSSIRPTTRPACSSAIPRNFPPIQRETRPPPH